MFLLTALAMTTAAVPANVARLTDCKPMLSLAATDRDGPATASRDQAPRKPQPKPLPKPCITLAAA